MIYEQDSTSVIPSEYCRYVCSLDGNKLSIILALESQSIIRTITLNDSVAGRIRALRWSKPPGPVIPEPDAFTPDSQRILCASGNHISVWDLHDESWSAEIEAGDAFNFTLVDFAFSHDEVIAFSEFNVHLTIFSLSTGGQRVIKSPKFANVTGYGFRPVTGHLALLVKLDANDTLTVHEPGTYEAIAAVTLNTIDAQGLKWSPDGAWLAVWDSASAVPKVAVYTAGGQHYRTYSDVANDDSLGVKMIEWSPDSRLMAIGKHDGTVTLINCKTFVLQSVLEDPMSFGSIGRDIYAEQRTPMVNGTEYILAPKSPFFPYTYNITGGTRAVSSIVFNPTGDMMVTIDQGLPHIVWMWSMKGQTPTLIGALIQKSNIRQLLWNPKFPELLMTVNDGDIPSAHQWICNRHPRISRIPFANAGKFSASWVKADSNGSGLMWFGWQSGYTFGYVTGSGTESSFTPVLNIEGDHPALSMDDFPTT
ncbi:WD40 domain-containing protein [Paracoccidioides lutzii Pb01]|uniref:WD40 domain-containing protein n=1 Tax=Paracoccidioides lutzii (strain ATCC MYA-826 / Pb01) TaxID=502779 RepID=C1HCQ1_PARBA|nr:WD40 domain-containing protein [Paracoccidioides lutzii Pb01]EEH38815.2 WD40 domain-containing protein [Paracoccidioides lutzii Pb01]